MRHQKNILHATLIGGVDCKEEQDDYERNPLQFWKKYQSKYPALSLVVRQVFAIPASSTSCERVFSIMKALLYGKRSGKNHCTLDMETFISSFLRSQQV